MALANDDVIKTFPSDRADQPAPDSCDRPRLFRVTHVFHPLYGREFTLVERRSAWGEERVFDSEVQVMRAGYLDVSARQLPAGFLPWRLSDDGAPLMDYRDDHLRRRNEQKRACLSI
jgi:Family of unknown function (DUF5372)